MICFTLLVVPKGAMKRSGDIPRKSRCWAKLKVVLSSNLSARCLSRGRAKACNRVSWHLDQVLGLPDAMILISSLQGPYNLIAVIVTPRKFSECHLKRNHFKRKIVFQLPTSIFQGICSLSGGYRTIDQQ